MKAGHADLLAALAAGDLWNGLKNIDEGSMIVQHNSKTPGALGQTSKLSSYVNK